MIYQNPPQLSLDLSPLGVECDGVGVAAAAADGQQQHGNHTEPDSHPGSLKLNIQQLQNDALIQSVLFNTRVVADSSLNLNPVSVSFSKNPFLPFGTRDRRL